MADTSIGSAIQTGLAQRAQRVAAGGGSSSIGVTNVEQTLTVVGSAVGTWYWNKSRPNPGTWAVGEMLIGLAISAGAGASENPLRRVATGVVTGALLSVLVGTAPAS